MKIEVRLIHFSHEVHMHATYDSDPEHTMSFILLRLQLQSKVRPQLGSRNIYSCSGCWVRRPSSVQGIFITSLVEKTRWTPICYSWR